MFNCNKHVCLVVMGAHYTRFHYIYNLQPPQTQGFEQLALIEHEIIIWVILYV